MRIRFEIEYGDRRKTIEAATPQAAWKIFRSPPDGSGMLRFREVPWNGKYSWDQKEGRARRGQWYFVETSWMSSNPLPSQERGK